MEFVALENDKKKKSNAFKIMIRFVGSMMRHVSSIIELYDSHVTKKNRITGDFGF